MKKQKVKVSKSRQINTYYEMWRVSYWTLHQAENEVKGSYFQIMASLIYTAFTLEAYLNHKGKEIFTCWDDLEMLSPRKKLNVIAERLGVEKDDGKRPFQTVKKLLDFRNDVAHGKTVFLETKNEIHIVNSKLDDYMHEPLEAEWEKYCTLDNAKRAREDVENIMRKFHNVSNKGDDDLFFPVSWSSDATLIHEK